MKSNNIFLGLLSGTSMDAIDVGTFDFNQPNYCLGFKEYPFPPDLRHSCEQLLNEQKFSLPELGALNIKLGKFFADCVNNFLATNNLSAKDIKAIGSHGQNIFHQPTGQDAFSWQIGCPHTIAANTEITTVADFRMKNIAVGGQGAPLAGSFHQHFFADPELKRGIVNIGGIANISILSGLELASCYDLGPGNCLMDLWCKAHFAVAYDQDGQYAQQGKQIPALLKQLLQDPYFAKPAPKSTGKEYFNLSWLQQFLQPEYDAIDVQKTLLDFCVTVISDAVATYDLDEVYLCGGGAYNQYLLQELRAKIAMPVALTDKLGIAANAVEAGLFAWLAQQNLQGKSAQLKAVTGAKRETILGAVIYP